MQTSQNQHLLYCWSVRSENEVDLALLEQCGWVINMFQQLMLNCKLQPFELLVKILDMSSCSFCFSTNSQPDWTWSSWVSERRKPERFGEVVDKNFTVTPSVTCKWDEYVERVTWANMITHIRSWPLEKWSFPSSAFEFEAGAGMYLSEDIFTEELEHHILFLTEVQPQWLLSESPK